MKKKLLLLFAVVATAINASAYSFSAENSDGVTIYYNYNGSSSVIVTYNTTDGSSYSGNVVIPESVLFGKNSYPVTEIQMEAFKNCTGLTSVTIPNSVTTIGEKAFYGCTGLTSATIGNCVTSMGTSVFSGCTGLKSITIGSVGTTIQNYTFQNCSSLTSVTIPNGVTSIGNLAFNGCSVLTSVTIPEGVTSIGKNAFYGCKLLTSVVIPASVTSISDYAFNSCSDLKEVISLNTSVPSIGSSCFSETHSSLKIKVPGTSIKTYREATKWSDYASKIQAISLALTDAEEYTYDFNFVSGTTTYTRNVSHNNWHGFYLPYDIEVSALSGTCATLTTVSDNTLNWTTQSSGTIAAGTPFIYKPTAAGDITFSVTDATIHSCTESHPVTDNGYTLSGTYTTKSDMATTKAYALSNGNFYYTTDNGKTLKPYRIYLTVPSSKSGAPVRCRIDGEDVTAIEDIDIDVDLQNKQYNLLGQPVGSDYKGIVIVNGKKTLRK